MENIDPIIDRIALNLQYSGDYEPAIVTRVIQAHEAVIADVAEELGDPELLAHFEGKHAGLAAVMFSMERLEGIYPNITPYIAQRALEYMGLDDVK